MEQVNAPLEVQVPSAVPVVSVAVDANAAPVYSVIASPPFDVGAAHVTAAVLPLKVAATVVGAPGAVMACAVAVELNTENAPYPFALFFAFTANL
jgi:hypothetical protein